MSSRTVASANVLRDLSRVEASRALDGVLAEQPDLVALQEWDLPRLPLLRASGTLLLVPGPRRRIPASTPRPSYAWVAPLVGGTVVGARTDRFELVDRRAVLLSGIGRSDNPGRRWHLEPPRVATMATFRDHADEATVSLLSYHLVPGVEEEGRYRDDRPRVSGRHRRELARLQRVMDEARARGDQVYAAGDSNFDGFRVGGLVSLWEGRSDEPGTRGPHRKIDDVHSVVPATSVRLLANASDHKAVLATWKDESDPG